jgi:hypothetical protein
MKRRITVRNPKSGRADLPVRPIIRPARSSAGRKNRSPAISPKGPIAHLIQSSLFSVRCSMLPSRSVPSVTSVCSCSSPVPHSAFRKITKRTHFVIMNCSITTTVYPHRVRNRQEKRTHFVGQASCLSRRSATKADLSPYSPYPYHSPIHESKNPSTHPAKSFHPHSSHFPTGSDRLGPYRTKALPGGGVAPRVHAASPPRVSQAARHCPNSQPAQPRHAQMSIDLIIIDYSRRFAITLRLSEEIGTVPAQVETQNFLIKD